MPETAAPSHPAALARNWGFVLARGLAAVAFGALAIALPGATLVTLLLLWAAYLVVDGVCAIASGVRAARRGERWGWLVVEGAAGLATAAAALLVPGLTVLAVMLLVGVWAVASGAAMAMAALRLGRGRGRGWLLAAGGLSVLWGALLLVAPLAGALALALWLGAYAFGFGVALLVLAWRLRREHRATLPGAMPASVRG